MSVIPTDAQPCNEKLLSDLLNENTSDILPQSRNEAFLLGLINKVVPDITPVSRVECYLKALCEKNAAITPDDTTVDGKPWTSKKIVDTICQPIEETGNPVQVYPVEAYPLGVKVSLEPVQDGSGDPSPDNIRPIKGRDSVTVTRCGKNLWKLGNAEFNQYKEISVFFPSGCYVFSGNVDTEVNTETVQIGVKIDNFWKYFQKDKNKRFRIDISANHSITGFRLYAGVGPESKEKAVYSQLQLELGTTATPYELYTGDTYTAELPETIYGGELDWNTGVLTVVDKILTITGNEGWNLDDDDNNKRRYSYVISRLNATVTFSDKVATHFTSNGVSGVANGFEYGKYFMSSRQLVIFDKNRHFESLEQFKAYLSAQYAAGTPVQVCYKLNTPYTIQLTPQQIAALSGVNTIYTDANGVIVTGAEDPKHTITELKNAIISLGGNV